MREVLPELGLVAALVLVNALFAGSEIALISLREGEVARLADQSRTGRTLARLVRDPNRFLGTIQVGITLAGFLASAVAAVSLAEPLVAPFGFLGAAARPAAIVVVTLLLTFVTLVLGQLAPKRLAMQRPRRWGLLAARPLYWLAQLALPVVWLLGLTTDVVVRLLVVTRAVTGRRSPGGNWWIWLRAKRLSAVNNAGSFPELLRSGTVGFVMCWSRAERYSL